MPRVQPNEFFQKLLALFPKMAPCVSTDVQRTEWVQALLPFEHDFAMEALRQYYRRHNRGNPSLDMLINFFEEYRDEKRRAVFREQKDANLNEMLKEGMARAAGRSSPEDARVARHHIRLVEMGRYHPRHGVEIAKLWKTWQDDYPDFEWAQYCREQAELWTQEAIKWHQKHGSAGPAAKHAPALITASSEASQ